MYLMTKNWQKAETTSWRCRPQPGRPLLCREEDRRPGRLHPSPEIPDAVRERVRSDDRVEGDLEEVDPCLPLPPAGLLVGREDPSAPPEAPEDVCPLLIGPVEDLGSPAQVDRRRRDEAQETARQRDHQRDARVSRDVPRLLEVPARHDVEREIDARRRHTIVHPRRVRRPILVDRRDHREVVRPQLVAHQIEGDTLLLGAPIGRRQYRRAAATRPSLRIARSGPVVLNALAFDAGDMISAHGTPPSAPTRSGIRSSHRQYGYQDRLDGRSLGPAGTS